MIPEDLMARYLAASGRERKALLKEVLALDPGVDEATVMAPTLRDPSPRVAARVTALLARHRLRDLFEKQLVNLKPGKIQLLRGHFNKIVGVKSAAKVEPEGDGEATGSGEATESAE